MRSHPSLGMSLKSFHHWVPGELCGKITRVRKPSMAYPVSMPKKLCFMMIFVLLRTFCTIYCAYVKWQIYKILSPTVITSSEKVSFFISENVKGILWKTTTVFWSRFLWLHHTLSCARPYRDRRKTQREVRMGWGVGAKWLQQKACAFSNTIYVYWLLPLQKPPSRPPIRPDHANSESPPWGTWELNF